MNSQKKMLGPVPFAVPMILAVLASASCNSKTYPEPDPDALAAWEESMRDAGGRTNGPGAALDDESGDEPGESAPPVTSIDPGGSVGGQSGGAMASGTCSGDAGACLLPGDAGVGPVCMANGPRDCASELDNDCDGQPDNVVDDVCVCALGTSEACEEHPGLDGNGSCRAGLRTCVLAADGLATEWGACEGSVGPEGPDSCTVRGDDADCDGTPNSDCPCVDGDTQQCGSPTDTGPCSIGTSTCVNGRFGACVGATPPAPQDSCAPGDDSNCNGRANDRFCACLDGDTQQCGVTSTGVCELGTQTCVNGAFGQCVGQVNPRSRDCRSQQDNNCDGQPDNTRDNVCRCAIGSSQACETHPGLDGIGQCRAGSQTCVAGAGNSSSTFGACMGSVGPAAQDSCSVEGDDANCNGIPNESCRNLGDPCERAEQCRNNLRCDVFYADLDRDGFAPAGAVAQGVCVTAAFAPDQKTRRAPLDEASTDCLDSTGNVSPAQAQFFTTASGGRPNGLVFDYNCDGEAEIRYQSNTIRSVSPAGAVTCNFAPFDVCNGGKVWITDSGEPLPDSTTCGQSSFVQICGPVLPQPSFPGVGCAGGDIVAEVVACR